MNKFRLTISSIIFSIMAGCYTVPANRLPPSQNTLNELIIKNGTFSPVFEMKLTDLETNNIFSCNTILAKSECSLGFQAIKLTNHPAKVSWTQNGRQYTQSLPNNLQPKPNSGKNFKAVVTLLDNGKLELSLE